VNILHIKSPLLFIYIINISQIYQLQFVNVNGSPVTQAQPPAGSE